LTVLNYFFLMYICGGYLSHDLIPPVTEVAAENRLKLGDSSRKQTGNMCNSENVAVSVRNIVTNSRKQCAAVYLLYYSCQLIGRYNSKMYCL
jgi:hypothetical protein